jgi:AmmeMemoRadiSam system protein B
MKTRAALFAGSWYPSGEEECRRQIESFFDRIPAVPEGTGAPMGGIVPHAGWAYSGRIAAEIVGLLKTGDQPETVILFGGHLGPNSPNFMMAEGGWETPFGPLEVDREMAHLLMEGFSLRLEEPETAQPDNTRELQLPLIRYAFPKARILPLATAPTVEGIQIGIRCAQISRELRRRVVVLGSTDLTHYGISYGFTPQGRGKEAENWVREVQDPAVIERMVQMDPQGILREALEHHNACCPGAAAAAVACMKALDARLPQVVSYATSNEVAQGEDFVGYVGILYWS